jgi:hypothetical protein
MKNCVYQERETAVVKEIMFEESSLLAILSWTNFLTANQKSQNPISDYT